MRKLSQRRKDMTRGEKRNKKKVKKEIAEFFKNTESFQN